MITRKRTNIEIKDNNDFLVYDVFAQKDWSYAAHYDELLQETKKIELKQLEIPYIKE